MDTVRVTLRKGQGTERFWAMVEARGPKFTLYVPLKADGDDKGYFDKDGNACLPKTLVDNSLIVKEEPAMMSKTYGWFEVVK